MELYQQLEQEWARWNDLDPVGMVACSSGTSALHLALEAMQLPQGSEVIVPDLCMIAVPRAVSMAGLVPVFVGCDDTLNMDASLIDAACAYDQMEWLNKKPPDIGAILLVHTYGKQFQFGDDWTIHDMWRQIEDLAEAHGVKPHIMTDAATWSFYSNKVVSGAEGGAVWFRDPKHAALARQLRSLGFTDAHDFTHIPRGHNYRMSNVHASLILDSLRRVDLSLENRWVQWETYNAICPQKWRMARPDMPWVYAFRIPELLIDTTDEIVKTLHSAGIQARHCFKPAHMQEEFRKCRIVPDDKGCYIKSWLAACEVMYLPLHNTTTRCHLDAFDIIKRVIG